MSTEKRESRRYSVQLAAEVTAEGDILVASTHDLSAGGVRLHVDRALPEGATLRVTLFLTEDGIEDPDEEPFEAKCRVQWCAERDEGTYALGVKFGSLDRAQSRVLARFLEQLERGN